jgi:sugar phosphate isomerase/epimerase
MSIIINSKIKQNLNTYLNLTQSLIYINKTDLNAIYFDGIFNEENLNLIKDNNLSIKYLAISNTFNVNDNEFNYLEIIKKNISICQSNKINNLVIPMIEYNDFIKDSNDLTQIINSIYALEKKYKVNIIIKPNYKKDLNIFHALTNNCKNIKIFFSLEEIYLNNLSITTNYRLLKDYIYLIECSDIDDHKAPCLLGYGILEIVEFFKKLNRDKYNKDILYTCNIYPLYSKAKDTNKFLAFFQPKRKKLKKSLQEKLDIDTANIEFVDMFLKQVSIIKIMGKNI